MSLAVPEGQFTTLLGPSGCGKTTTLRCVAGLERPDAGELEIAGRIVNSPKRRIYVATEKRDIGMVFQSYAIWPHMTVFDNVAYGLRVRKRPEAEVTTRVREALELVQLGELGTRGASKLSGGQQQRVALARAFVVRPQVLLADEPTGSLDFATGETVMQLMFELNREVGTTLVLVTHDDKVAERAHRIGRQRHLGSSARSGCGYSHHRC